MKKILITGANSYIGKSFDSYLKQWPEEYLVDTMDGNVYGPYSGQEEWMAQCHAAGAEDLPAWRSTDGLGAYANGE